MTSISLQIPDAARPELPEAMVFSTPLLLSQKSSVAAKFGSSDIKTEPLTIRANSLTAILKKIPAYSHDGLNE